MPFKVKEFREKRNMTRLEHRMQRLPDIKDRVEHNLEEKRHSLEVAKKEIERTWPLQEKLDACLKRAKELDSLLLEDEKSKDGPEETASVEKKVVACR